MIKLNNNGRDDLKMLAEIAAEGFKHNPAFYLWGESDKHRLQVLTEFFEIVLFQLIEKEMAYTTSLDYEGICCFWTKKTKFSFKHKLSLLKLLRHFSFGRLLKLIKQFSKLRGAERLMKNEKDYLFVFMIVIQKPYRGQGHMRKIMNFILNESDKRGVPCILETDSLRNTQIYNHLGMKTLSTQYLNPALTYYILRYNN